MSAEEALARWCQAGGLGEVGKSLWWPLIQSRSTYPAASFTPYPGLVLETFGGSEQRPRVQVVVKSQAGLYNEGKAFADQLWERLADAVDVPQGDDEVPLGYVRPTSTVGYLQQDTSDRHTWSFDVEVTP